MEKLKHRAVIKYQYKKELKPKQNHEDMATLWGHLIFHTQWSQNGQGDLKRGKDSIEDLQPLPLKKIPI